MNKQIATAKQTEQRSLKQTYRCAHKLLDTYPPTKVVPEQDTMMSELYFSNFPLINEIPF